MSGGPRVTIEAIEAQIAGEMSFTAGNAAMALGIPSTEPAHLLTICVLTLKNGFTVTGTSACVSVENFDPAIGRKIARDKAIDQLWQLLGFRLMDALAAEASGA